MRDRETASHTFSGFPGSLRPASCLSKGCLRRLYFWRPFASSFEGSPLHVYLLTSREFQFGNRRPAITSCPVVHLVAISICRGLRYRWHVAPSRYASRKAISATSPSLHAGRRCFRQDQSVLQAPLASSNL